MHARVKPPGTLHWACEMVSLVFEATTTQGVSTGLVIKEPRKNQIYQDTLILLEFVSSGFHHRNFLTALSSTFSLAKFQISKHPFRLCLSVLSLVCSYRPDLNPIHHRGEGPVWDISGSNAKINLEIVPTRSPKVTERMLRLTYKTWFDTKT